ncbi:hypothetical protein FRC03_006081 [Tulasnella sp. 419]|nr:hypothetical protein FRC03_006081 [Tulasnella sp. 419]
MPRKKINRTDEDGDSSAVEVADNLEPTPKPSTPPVAVVYEPVKVNNANLTELKFALDDALKRFLSHPDRFSTINTHTDVRLGLGYANVAIAIATGLYSWKISFHESKFVVMIGVVAYTLLSAIQMAYVYFVEGETIFVGKRKTLAKRIETEKVKAESRTTNPESNSLPPSSAPANVSLFTNYPRGKSSYLPPHYKLSLTYTNTASGGKSLIRKGKVEDERCYADFFDEDEEKGAKSY